MLPACTTTQQNTDQALVQVDDSLKIKGKVKKISQENNTMTVKPYKGEAVTVTFTEDTTLTGFLSTELIEKKTAD